MNKEQFIEILQLNGFEIQSRRSIFDFDGCITYDKINLIKYGIEFDIIKIELCTDSKYINLNCYKNYRNYLQFLNTIENTLTFLGIDIP